jgi:hypothetical protein
VALTRTRGFLRGGAVDLSSEQPGVRRRFDSTPNGGAQPTKPAVTARGAMLRGVLLASTRGGLHATVGWTVVSACAMHGAQIPHSSVSSL